jgi:ABC-type uncharacterized transport system substrate-binding protein
VATSSPTRRLGAGAAWPLAARGQQPERIRRIGVLTPSGESDPVNRANVTLFRETLRKLGWVEGRNIRIDYRWGPDGNRIRAYAEELVELALEVIFVSGTPGVAALKQMTRTIPIVFANLPDPIVITHPCPLDHAAMRSGAGAARAPRMAASAVPPASRPVATTEQRSA